jgi:simple sugar transport system ATP-binding protein
MSLKTSPSPILSLRGITKSFPGVLANDHIDLDFYPGEIHALLGENGAGKSTLMKILYGFYKSDAGEISINGQPVQIHSPHDARSQKIGMVFQDLNLIPAFSVAENIALFLPGLKSVIDPEEIGKKIVEVSRQYDLHVNPRSLASQLSLGEQQKVEIIKLLLSDARILILDEPTRVLAPHEVEGLFRVLDNLRKDGFAIILITHKLQEVLNSADRITVLRAGKVAGTMLRETANQQKLIALMFEKTITEIDRIGPVAATEISKPILELSGISTLSDGFNIGLKDINLKIHPGEIVGIAGVSGNGQRELGEMILGMDPIQKGKKLLFGEDATNYGIGKLRGKGVVFIPESPLQMAVVPWFPVLLNSVLTRTSRYAQKGGFSMNWGAASRDLSESYKNLGFTPPSFYTQAKSLSGGNLQRLIIARELTFSPRLILASYLTRGLDVQSAVAARQALLTARGAGVAVLFISEDLEELFSLCDRLVVLFEGRIVGEFNPAETTSYEIGLLMTGSKVMN